MAWHQVGVGKEARKAETREGKLKSYEAACIWARNFIRTTEMVFLVEVCHVERNRSGRLEDVPVHKYFNSMGVWKQTVLKRPWFEGDYQ